MTNGPVRVADSIIYPTDDFSLRLLFRISEGVVGLSEFWNGVDLTWDELADVTWDNFGLDGNPIDVSEYSFIARGFNQADQDLQPPIVDISSASEGFVFLRWSATQIKALPVYSQWSLAEQGHWNRTMLIGRLTKVRP